MIADRRASRIMTWALAAGTAIGITVFGLFYSYTDGWAENTTRPPQAHYEQVTPDDLEAWPWTYKRRLVVTTGDVRRVTDGPTYIDPQVHLFGRRLLGGLRVQKQVLLNSGGQSEAIVGIDFWTPAQLPGRLTVWGRVRGPSALTNPIGEQPERPVIEAYLVCAADGTCWQP